MIVDTKWLKQLVKYNLSNSELAELLEKHTIGTKDVSEDFIELDMKGYNRADLLSLRGVATEVAALTQTELNFVDEPEQLEYAVDALSTKVDSALSSVYCLVKISGLKVEASPSEIQEKLTNSGLRPVNNLTDITNLMMLEYGQPMHAFDANQVINNQVIVRRAEDGEKILTLDAKERSLDANDIVIADSEKLLGIAGVMGGKSSEISDTTTEILLEAAIFDPASLRATSNKLGLITDASKRFYHGLSRRRLVQALNRAIVMYQELGGVVKAISINGEFEDPENTQTLRLEKLNSLIGVKFEKHLVEEFLQRLNFELETIDGGWSVRVPYFRSDIRYEVDLIEEVARIYGYHNIPAKQLSGEIPKQLDQSLFQKIRTLKNNLVELGLSELQTYSFVSTEVYNNLSLDRSRLIKLENPISAETEYMRTAIWPTLVEKTAMNLKNFDNIAIFEIGKIYLKNDQEIVEKYVLSLALSNQSENPIAELNAILNQLAQSLKTELKTEKADGNEYFHPTRNFSLSAEGLGDGFAAEVHPRLLDKFGVKVRVAVAEIVF